MTPRPSGGQHWARIPLAGSCAAILALVACDGGGSGTGGSGGAGGTGGGGGSAPTSIINLVVDANRDGVAMADGTDEAGEDAFSATAGASFLANLDDDDGDELRDVDDEIINGPEDEKDLARILVQAWPDAPEGSAGTLTLDTASGDKVRVWRKATDGSWSLVLGATQCDQQQTMPLTEDEVLTCTPVVTYALATADLQAGVEFGIEARTFRTSLAASAWTGMATVTLAVVDSAGAPIEGDPGAPGGVDTVQLKVAPWLLHGNLSAFDRVHFQDWGNDPDAGVFTTEMKAYANGAGNTPLSYKNWGDQWTQDFFQTGFTSIPAPNGAVQGMMIANSRPWGRCGSDTNTCHPMYWLRKNYLAADAGIVETYKLTYNAAGQQAWLGDSYDSHGNHDLLPPYSNGAEDYPLGRILHGSGIIKDTREFYKAQELQTPLVINTSFLIVGHVDETLSYAPSNTPRGWKLMVAWPDLAIQMLQAEQMAGNGSAKFFEGQLRYVGNNLVDATTTIDDVLADTNGVMAWSAIVQSEIEGQIADIKAGTGLTDDEIIHLPILFEQDSGAHVSWDPGTVNMLVMKGAMAIPKPFAPVVGGKDIWEDFIKTELGTSKRSLGVDGQGMDITFIDDWYGYHILLGEVHCGSNPETPPPASSQWWLAVK